MLDSVVTLGAERFHAPNLHLSHAHSCLTGLQAFGSLILADIAHAVTFLLTLFVITG